MSRNWVLWVLAGVVTLTSAVWQRLSGPTYPVRGTPVASSENLTEGGHVLPLGI